jgi:hypothetical protein
MWGSQELIHLSRPFGQIPVGCCLLWRLPHPKRIATSHPARGGRCALNPDPIATNSRQHLRLIHVPDERLSPRCNARRKSRAMSLTAGTDTPTSARTLTPYAMKMLKPTTRSHRVMGEDHMRGTALPRIRVRRRSVREVLSPRWRFPRLRLDAARAWRSCGRIGRSAELH